MESMQGAETASHRAIANTAAWSASKLLWAICHVALVAEW
jgi:hypothetical protein